MTATDKLLDNAERYASEFDHGRARPCPARARSAGSSTR